MNNRYDVNFVLKIDIKKVFFDQVTFFMSKKNSSGGDAEVKKIKRLKFISLFGLLIFALNDKVISTVAIQQSTL